MLLFAFNYPPIDGGVARLCAELAMGLERRDVRVRILSQRREGGDSLIPPLPEQRVTMRRPWREISALGSLRHIAQGEPVVCGTWYPEGLLASLAGVRPLVILAHGVELNPSRQRWRRRAWQKMMQQVLRHATVVIANSRYTAERVDRFAPGAQVAALPLGVDRRRFRPGDRLAARRRLAIPNDKHVIVTVARVVAHKGHRHVLEALASLAEPVRERFLYLVAGRGRELAALQEEANRLGLNKVVRWLGYVPEQDLPELYHSADLFVLCTREEPDHPDVEGFGLAFLEAQACGIPVVGTRTGGIVDAIEEGRGGWLVDQGDVATLRSILLSLAETPERFREAGLAARQRVERECTWDHYIDRLVETLAAHGVSLS